MNLYVSNLGEQITEESLRAVFATFGEVSSSVVVRDQPHPRRGIAYIEMPDPASAHNAISRINGAVLNGRAISVEIAGSSRANDRN